MSRHVIIESECTVNHLDFPTHLDHAWLALAAGIHSRLFNVAPNGDQTQAAIESCSQISNQHFLIKLNTKRTWMDGAAITAEEIVFVLKRGQAFSNLSFFDDVQIADPEHISISSTVNIELMMELLASPIFTVTPSIRKVNKLKNSVATCGDYFLKANSANYKILKFQKRFNILEDIGPSEITFVVTDNSQQGIRLLKNHQLTLSSPLGAEPNQFEELASVNTIKNRLTNLAMVLRPYPDSALSKDPQSLRAISQSLNRDSLAKSTAHTFAPLTNVSSLFNTTDNSQFIRSDSCNQSDSYNKYTNNQELEIRYPEYAPNRLVASNIANQLKTNLGISAEIKPVRYKDYINNVFEKKNGLSLEIIQPILPEFYINKLWNFLDMRLDINKTSFQLDEKSSQKKILAIPLLQNYTTLISLDNRYRNQHILTVEALLDWSSL